MKSENPSWPPVTYSAFESGHKIAQGSIFEVVQKVKRGLGGSNHSQAIIFSDLTGVTMDVNFQGTLKDVLHRLEVFQTASTPEVSGPGRPKLGVVSREISLLPSQWEWLATQSGGASATLRRLVDAAKRKAIESPTSAQLQERVYRFLSVIAGDLPLYEETLRALYQRNESKFLAGMQNWPTDICQHAKTLAEPIFITSAKTKGQP